MKLYVKKPLSHNHDVVYRGEGGKGGIILAKCSDFVSVVMLIINIIIYVHSKTESLFVGGMYTSSDYLICSVVHADDANKDDGLPLEANGLP